MEPLKTMQRWNIRSSYAVRRRPAPRLLQNMCYIQIKSEIVCTYTYNKLLNQLDKVFEPLERYYSQLPATVRLTLWWQVLHNIRWDCALVLHVSKLLFPAQVLRISIPLMINVDEDDFHALLHLMSEVGSGLTSLEFKGVSFLMEYKLDPICYDCFAKVFVTAKQLTTLALPSLGTNYLMKLVGENCHRLRSLDISNSAVSEKGLNWLTQNMVRVPDATDAHAEKWDDSSWGIPHVCLPLQKLIPPGESGKCYERRRSPLCETLQTLVHCSWFKNRAFRGLLMILELVPNLKTIGDVDMSVAFERLREEWIKNETNRDEIPVLKLTKLSIDTTSEEIFDLVKSTCPGIVELRYNPRRSSSPLPIQAFNSFNFLEDLTILGMRNLYKDEDFCKLHPEISERLKVLNLKFTTNSYMLSIFFSQFPQLQKLVLGSPIDADYRNTHFKWGDILPTSTLKHLKDITLNGNVPAEALFKIICNAPNLNMIEIANITQRQDDFLEKLRKVQDLPKLQIMSVYDGIFLDTEEELNVFLTLFKNIIKVGQLRFLRNRLILYESEEEEIESL